MATQTKNPSLEEFLAVTAGSKDVGLIIAKDGNELESFLEMLHKSDWQSVTSIFEYENKKHGQYLVVASKEELKPIYDFVCQYPITVISLFNSKDSKIVVIKPDYKFPLVLVMTNEMVKEFEKKSLDILGRVGLKYRSNI